MRIDSWHGPHLDVLNRVAALHLECDGLARQRLDEDLHGDRSPLRGGGRLLVRGRLPSGGLVVTEARGAGDDGRRFKPSGGEF